MILTFKTIPTTRLLKSEIQNYDTCNKQASTI